MNVSEEMIEAGAKAAEGYGISALGAGVTLAAIYRAMRAAEKPSDDLVEAVARAIAASNREDLDELMAGQDQPIWKLYIEDARAALSVLQESDDERQQADIASLREALGPFATVAAELGPDVPDGTWCFVSGLTKDCFVTASELRRARAALEQTK